MSNILIVLTTEKDFLDKEKYNLGTNPRLPVQNQAIVVLKASLLTSDGISGQD